MQQCLICYMNWRFMKRRKRDKNNE
jgi:hypothetical protein